jgi:hypothetical protein
MALRVAIIGLLVNASLLLYVTSTRHNLGSEYSKKIGLFSLGVSFMIESFALYGSLELSKQLVGRAALGAKLAAFGWATSLALTVLSIATRSHHDWNVYVQWGYFGAKTCVGLGLVLAIWKRPVIGVVCFVAWIAIARPPVLEKWLYEQTRESWQYVRCATQLAYAALLLVLAMLAVADLPDEFVMRDAQRAKLGLGRMAGALWLRLCALIVVPLLTVLLVSDGGAGSEKTIGYGMIFAAGVNVLSFVVFGFGALDIARSRHLQVRPGPFLVAAAGSLWCAGVSLHQLEDLYDRMVGHSSAWLGYGEGDYAMMFPYVMPIVASVTIIAAALAIAGFAERREHLELAGRGERTAVLVGVLQLLTLGTLSYLLPEARGTSSFLVLTLMALTFGVIALVSAARLARDAAVVVEAAPPTIPSAQLL